MRLDARKVILAMVMFSNIGGASTGIGDPPNVLIINSPLLKVISFSIKSLPCYCSRLLVRVCQFQDYSCECIPFNPFIVIPHVYISLQSITFGKFTGHMMVGAVFCFLAAYLYFWFVFLFRSFPLQIG